MIPISKVVIFFGGHLSLTEGNFFEKLEVIFPVGTYWRIVSDTGQSLLLQDVRSGQRKIVTYGMFGKMMAQRSDKIFFLEEKDVPKIIQLKA